MNKVDLTDYLETMIHVKSKAIVERRMLDGSAALGELTIYYCLRRILNNKATLQDIGVLHAVNHLMQVVGLLDPKETLGSTLEK
ncbi:MULTISPECIES: hypothetical protein [unclassified Pseudomonas]|uniref:hypothetical protein n=1 Tax=unclassified Pseudomonas TaxID=196821 RepID=UPI0019130944|nr:MULTISPECIES: hypothetical protein [unclassified Pseudomonas]MBK5549954.1 hypothetical protein [Pseudomonas sp. TH03]MEB0226506.1 hypothetical protein [Pseudomonas sp. 5S1]MEB0295587.1 hypothetical protein [Pseudomonas sp. 10S4]WPX21147.1 hypothetical protein RHM58_15610 [Pseudomonas sp. 10S4]